MLLGVIVERCAGTSLAAYCRRRIYEPLSISSLAFLNREEADTQDPTEIVPTEWDRWRNRLLCGEVHDETPTHWEAVPGTPGCSERLTPSASFQPHGFTRYTAVTEY